MGDFVPDVGVLVVHGIGTQAEGSEQRQWVDSVVAYLSALGQDAGVGDATAILEAGPADDPLIRVHTPPLGEGEGRRRQRWLVGEAWWADAFAVPGRAEVTSWLAGVAAWFVYFWVVRVWRRFGVRGRHILAGVAFAGTTVYLLSAALEEEGLRLPVAFVVLAAVAVALVGLTGTARLASLVVAASLVLLYPLAALATVGILLLWLVGLLPGKVSAKARAVQLSLARSVGDVYALISSREREQAMFDSLAASAGRLASSPGMVGKPVVILAHSMGAALCYRALNHDRGLASSLGGRDVTLITYGGAVVPVTVLDDRLRAEGNRWQRIQAFAGLVGLLLFALPVVRMATDAMDRLAVWLAGASALLVALTFARTWRQERAAPCAGHRFDPDQETQPSDAVPCVELRTAGARSFRWVDLWAPWDPVPNGPLDVGCPCSPSPCGPGPLPAPTKGAREFVSCRVANLHQPWRDHVVYRENHEEVVSRWVGEIAARGGDVAPGEVEHPRTGGTARAGRTARLHRGVSLLTAQIVTLLAGLVLLVCFWANLDDIGRVVARHVPVRAGVADLIDKVPTGLRDAVLGAHRDSWHLHGFLTALAVLLVLVVVVGLLVEALQRSATGRYLAGRDDRTLRLVGPAAAGMTLVALLAAAAVVGLVRTDQSVRRYLVHPATVEAAAGGPARSVATGVRFQPIGTGGGGPTEVGVGDEAVEVEVDARFRHEITASATGAGPCTVTVEDPGGGLVAWQVRTSCEPGPPVVPAAGP